MGCHSHFRDWYAGFNNTNVERWNSAAFIVYPKLVASNRRTDEPLHENQKQTMDGRAANFDSLALEKTNLDATRGMSLSTAPWEGVYHARYVPARFMQ